MVELHITMVNVLLTMVKIIIHGQLITMTMVNVVLTMVNHGQITHDHVTTSSQSERSSPEEMTLANKQNGDRSLTHIWTYIQPLCLKTGHERSNNTAIS